MKKKPVNNNFLGVYSILTKHLAFFKTPRSWNSITLLTLAIIVSAWLRIQIWVKEVSQFYRKIGPEVAVTSQTAGNKNSQASFHVNSKFPFSNSWSSSPLVETTAAVKLKIWLLMIVGLWSIKFGCPNLSKLKQSQV